MAKYDPSEIGYRLHLEGDYHNTLDVHGFSKMLKDPSYCYKFYWLEAIVKLIAENKTSATYSEIIDEMIANAWYSVLEFHVHLSGIWGDGEIKDSLERAVVKMHELSGLNTNASKVEIKNAITIYEKELHGEKHTLTLNVPYKALSGFANRCGEPIDLNSSAGRMMKYYNALNEKGMVLPYVFGEQKGLERRLIFHDSWVKLIQDNMVSILGWIQFEKVRWLQNNNPEVPGLVYKLAPLDDKMRKLNHVRNLWNGILDIREIVDIFKGEQINKNTYDVDHFIPWSFVMNDELWNLMPIDSSLNSSKSNRLPEWEKFFGKFAKNQYIMYEAMHELPGIRKLYESCYRDNLHSIWASQELYRKGNSKDEFMGILERNMRPVYDSAKRQGYDVWVCM